MRKRLKLVFRMSWIVTVPISALFLLWGSSTLDRYITFGIRHDSRPAKLSLARIGEEEAWNLYRRIYLAIDPRVPQWRIAGGGLRVVELFARQSALASLNSNLPYSGFEYVKGRIKNGKRIKKVKLRYRGDFLWHWWSAKKSYRVKTKKKKLYDGMRSFNLIAPKFTAQINNYLGYQLAQRIGLLAPHSEMINLTMNGQWMGVHLLVEQLDESTLRNNGLMPGDLYKGELAGKDGYTGISRHIFDHPGLWEKVSVNNHYPEESTAPLQKLLTLLRQGSTAESQKAASEFLDIEAWARFGAYETLVQTIHYGISHNWRLYYDPAREKLIPIIWDPDAWHPGWLPKEHEEPQYDFLPSVMQRFLHQNADYLRAKERILKDFFLEGEDTKFLKTAEVTARQVKAAIRVDPFSHAMPGRKPSGPEEKISAIDTLLIDITRIFSQIETQYQQRDKRVVYSVSEERGTYKLQVEGRGEVKRIQFLYSESTDKKIESVKLTYWKGADRREVDLSGAITQDKNTVTIDLNLIPQYQTVTKGSHPTKKYIISTSPGYYELALSDQRRVAHVLADYGDGTLQPASAVSDIDRLSFSDLHQIATHSPPENPLLWSDIVKVDGVWDIESDVFIKPGTNIQLGPRASIIFRGRVTISGSDDQPVIFSGGPENTEPWGSVVLKGEGANNSYFHGCLFRGGSGLKTSLREYSAMLSIHSVSGVVIEKCSFKKNFIVDDMLHAVYSNLTIRDSTFEEALSDAVDLDISTALIENSVFRKNGNDGLDLMTTDALVTGSTFSQNGDKGVSAGEASRLIAVDSTFTANEIGIQVKDGTLALLRRTSFSGNAKTIDAYKKNWRYGEGGQVFSLTANIQGPPTKVSADEHSEIRLYGGEMPDGTVLTGNVTSAKTVPKSQEFKNSEATLHQNSSAGFRHDHLRYWTDSAQVRN